VGWAARLLGAFCGNGEGASTGESRPARATLSVDAYTWRIPTNCCVLYAPCILKKQPTVLGHGAFWIFAGASDWSGPRRPSSSRGRRLDRVQKLPGRRKTDGDLRGDASNGLVPRNNEDGWRRRVLYAVLAYGIRKARPVTRRVFTNMPTCYLQAYRADTEHRGSRKMNGPCGSLE
jgi:hypothetical protein